MPRQVGPVPAQTPLLCQSSCAVCAPLRRHFEPSLPRQHRLGDDPVLTMSPRRLMARLLDVKPGLCASPRREQQKAKFRSAQKSWESSVLMPGPLSFRCTGCRMADPPRLPECGGRPRATCPRASSAVCADQRCSRARIRVRRQSTNARWGHGHQRFHTRLCTPHRPTYAWRPESRPDWGLRCPSACRECTRRPLHSPRLSQQRSLGSKIPASQRSLLARWNHTAPEPRTPRTVPLLELEGLCWPSWNRLAARPCRHQKRPPASERCLHLRKRRLSLRRPPRCGPPSGEVMHLRSCPACCPSRSWARRNSSMQRSCWQTLKVLVEAQPFQETSPAAAMALSPCPHRPARRKARLLCNTRRRGPENDLQRSTYFAPSAAPWRFLFAAAYSAGSPGSASLRLVYAPSPSLLWLHRIASGAVAQDCETCRASPAVWSSLA
mmetsp:Transcript_63368/g.151214  ORF Transcript_63368/g.151214 Transcript_63368/m.151214 type:complete len:437 (-) Transcript_63368:982-2292(-)